ncbi:hypothetical protein [Rhodococcus pyridinivorans]|uniref:hypothetical protein n=1 Tax=Rhodococcus pyridinivorans TaxID=103816 RepID=UPI003AAC52B4
MMHDPTVLAFTIRRPWPEIRKGRPHATARFPFVRFRNHELYFPDLINVWHVEPHGEDALRGECRGTRWKWHIHHWEIQWCFLQHWRRRLLTRCAWCGGRSTKRDAVNCSLSWDSPKQPLWRGETHLFHHDCSTVQAAHKVCLCDDPLLDSGDHGKCLMCGRFRAWRQTPTDATRYLAALPAGARIPPEDMPKLEAMWEKARQDRGASDA